MINFAKQIFILLCSAIIVLTVGAGIYWLFHAGRSYLAASESNNPLMSPILWFAIILVGVITIIAKIWRKYQERLFIKSLQQRRKQRKTVDQPYH